MRWKGTLQRWDLVTPLGHKREKCFLVICVLLTIYLLNYCISHFSDLTWFDRFVASWDFTDKKCFQAFTMSHVCPCRHPAGFCFLFQIFLKNIVFLLFCLWIVLMILRVSLSLTRWDIFTLFFFSCTWWHSWGWMLYVVLSNANHFVLCHCSVRSALSFLHVSQSPHHNSPLPFSANRTSPQRKPEVT